MAEQQYHSSSSTVMPQLQDLSMWLDVSTTTACLRKRGDTSGTPFFTPVNTTGRLKFVRLDENCFLLPATSSSIPPTEAGSRLAPIAWLSTPSELRASDVSHPVSDDPGRLTECAGLIPTGAVGSRIPALPTTHFATAWMVQKSAYFPPQNLLQHYGPDPETGSLLTSVLTPHTPCSISTGPFVCRLQPDPAGNSCMRLLVTVEYEAGVELKEASGAGISSRYTSANNGIVFLANYGNPWTIKEATPMSVVMHSSSSEDVGRTDRLVYLNLGVLSVVYSGDPEGIVRNVSTATTPPSPGNTNNQFGYGSVGLGAERTFTKVWSSRVADVAPAHRDPATETIPIVPPTNLITPPSVINEMLRLTAPENSDLRIYGFVVDPFDENLELSVLSRNADSVASQPIDLESIVCYVNPDLVVSGSTVASVMSLMPPLPKLDDDGTVSANDNNTNFSVSFNTSKNVNNTAFVCGSLGYYNTTSRESLHLEVNAGIPGTTIKNLRVHYYLSTVAEIQKVITQAAVATAASGDGVLDVRGIVPTARFTVSLDMTPDQETKALVSITFGNIWLPPNTGVVNPALQPVQLAFPGYDDIVPNFPIDGIPTASPVSRNIVVSVPIGCYGTFSESVVMGSGAGAAASSTPPQAILGVKRISHDFEGTYGNAVVVNFKIDGADVVIPPVTSSTTVTPPLIAWDPVFNQSVSPDVITLARPTGFKIVQYEQRQSSLAFRRVITVPPNTYTSSVFTRTFDQTADQRSAGLPGSSIISIDEAVEITQALLDEFVTDNENNASNLWKGEQLTKDPAGPRAIFSGILDWGRSIYRYCRYIEMISRGAGPPFSNYVLSAAAGGADKTLLVADTVSKAALNIWKGVREAITNGFVPKWPLLTDYARTPEYTRRVAKITGVDTTTKVITTEGAHNFVVGMRCVIRPYSSSDSSIPRNEDLIETDPISFGPNFVYYYIKSIVSPTSFTVRRLVGYHGTAHQPPFSPQDVAAPPDDISADLSISPIGQYFITIPRFFETITGFDVVYSGPFQSNLSIHSEIDTYTNEIIKTSAVRTLFQVVGGAGGAIPNASQKQDRLAQKYTYTDGRLPEHSSSVACTSVDNIARITEAAINQIVATEEASFTPSSSPSYITDRITESELRRLIAAAKAAISQNRFVTDHFAAFQQIRYDRSMQEDSRQTRSVWGGMTNRLLHELRRWAIVLNNDGDAPDLTGDIFEPTGETNYENCLVAPGLILPARLKRSWLRVIQLKNLALHPSAAVRQLQIIVPSAYGYYNDHHRTHGYLIYAAYIALRYGSTAAASFPGYGLPTTVSEDVITMLTSSAAVKYTAALEAQTSSATPPMPLLQILFDYICPPCETLVKIERGELTAAAAAALYPTGTSSCVGAATPVTTSADDDGVVKYYPPHRHFDVYHGHSWSTGPTAPFEIASHGCAGESALAYLAAFKFINAFRAYEAARVSAEFGGSGGGGGLMLTTLSPRAQKMIGYLYTSPSSATPNYPQIVCACLGSEIASSLLYRLSSGGMLAQASAKAAAWVKSAVTTGRRGGGYPVITSPSFVSLITSKFMSSISLIGVARSTASTFSQYAYRFFPTKFLLDVGTQIAPLSDITEVMFPPAWVTKILTSSASSFGGIISSSPTLPLALEMMISYILAQAPVAVTNDGYFDDPFWRPSLEVQQWARMIAAALRIKPSPVVANPPIQMRLSTTSQTVQAIPQITDPATHMAVVFPAPIVPTWPSDHTDKNFPSEPWPPSSASIVPENASRRFTTNDYYLPWSSWYDVLMWYRYTRVVTDSDASEPVKNDENPFNFPLH